VNHLNDQSGKMSKSKGDFLTVSLLEKKGYDPIAYRMFCLQSHYRKPLVFSYENLDNTTGAYEKLVKKIAGFKDEGEVDEAAYKEFRDKFEAALCNDLNTSMAITVVYDVVKADINDKTKLALLNDFDQVLSLNLTTAGAKLLDAGQSVDEGLEQFINEKIAERAEAKKAKDFARADAIRDELMEKGVAIKDTREGVVWELV
jgi:cysteinyl-tRNA synthetase